MVPGKMSGTNRAISMKRYPWDSFLKRGSSKQKVKSEVLTSGSITPRSRSSARPASVNSNVLDNLNQEGDAKDTEEVFPQRSRRRNLTPEMDRTQSDPWNSPTRQKPSSGPDLEISTPAVNTPVKSNSWNFLPPQIPVGVPALEEPESPQPPEGQNKELPSRSTSRTSSQESRPVVDAQTVFPMGKPVSEVDNLKRYPWDTMCARASSPVTKTPSGISPVQETEISVPPAVRSRSRTPSPVEPSTLPEPLDDKRPLSKSNVSVNVPEGEALREAQTSHISEALLLVGFPESRRYPSGTGSRGHQTVSEEEGNRPTLLESPQLLVSRSRSRSPVLPGTASQSRHSSPEKKDNEVDDLKRYPWDSLNARGKYFGENDPKQNTQDSTVGFFCSYETVQKGQDEHIGSGDGYELVSPSPKFPVSTSPQQLICRSETLLNSEHEESSSPPVRSTSCFDFCNRSNDVHSSIVEEPASSVTTLAMLEKTDMVTEYTDDKSAEATVHSVYEDVLEDSLRHAEPVGFRRCLSPVLETEEDSGTTHIRSFEENHPFFCPHSGGSLKYDGSSTADGSSHNRPPIDFLKSEDDAFSKRLLTDDEEDGPLFLSQYKPSKVLPKGQTNVHPQLEEDLQKDRSLAEKSTETGAEVAQDRSWQTLALIVLLSRFSLWYSDIQSRWFKRFLTAGHFLHHRSSRTQDFIVFATTQSRRNFYRYLPYIKSQLTVVQKALWRQKAAGAFLLGFLAYYALHYGVYSDGKRNTSLFNIGDLFVKSGADSPRDLLARWVMGGLIRDRQSSSFESVESAPAKTSVSHADKKERSSFWDFWLENPPEKYPSGGPREILAFWAMGNIFRGLGPYGVVDGGSKEKRVIPQKNVENVCSMLDVRCFVRSLKSALSVIS